MTTSIEWAKLGLDRGASINPTQGCERASTGCENCYAETQAARMRRMGRPEYQDVVTDGARWTRRGGTTPLKVLSVVRARTPTGYFWGSMSDLYFREFDDDLIFACIAVAAVTPRHRHMHLTKRAERLAEIHTELAREGPPRLYLAVKRVLEPLAGVGDRTVARMLDALGAMDRADLPNLVLAVSAENQPMADRRVPYLLEAPGMIHGVSYEPALGPVDWSPWLPKPLYACQRCGEEAGDGEEGAPDYHHGCGGAFDPAGSVDEVTLDWIIPGGESGRGKRIRSCNLAWIRSTIRQCVEAGVPCFTKQLGKFPIGHGGDVTPSRPMRPGPSYRSAIPPEAVGWEPDLALDLRHPKGGDPSEWPDDLKNMRQWPLAWSTR